MLLRPLGRRHEVDHLVVSVVPEVHLIIIVHLEDPLPLVLGEVGGAVHGAAVANDQAVAGLGPRQAEVRVLQLKHGLQEVGLELKPLGLSQQSETYLMYKSMLDKKNYMTKSTPPLRRIVAVSGTLNTRHPRDSKKVASLF